MSDRVQLPSYPGVEAAIDAIADWVNRYRRATRAGGALGSCSPLDVARVAVDLGLPLGEIRTIVHQQPGGTDLLREMLAALQVDMRKLAGLHQGVMRDLERLCISCSHKSRCAHEMDVGTAAAHYRDFCPNAFTLDALIADEKGVKPY